MESPQQFRSSEEKRRAALKDFDTFELPVRRFVDEAEAYVHEARILAREIRAQCVPRMGRLAVTEALLEACNWKIKYKEVTKVGGQERSPALSLLIPMIEGGFTVVINTLHNPDNDKTAALIGHEIGHSFFYNHSVRPPRRITHTIATTDEERFCDEFTYHLTDIRL